MKFISAVFFSTLFVFSSAQALDYHKDAIEKFEADKAVQAALNKKESEPAQVAQIMSGRVGGGRFHTYVVTQLVDVSHGETGVVAATVHYNPADQATVTVVEIKRLGKAVAAGAAANEIEAFELDSDVIAKVGGGKTKKPVALEIATAQVVDGEMEEYLVTQMVQPTSGPADAPSNAVMAVVHLDSISMTVQLVELVPKVK
jgi:hypothetical protein